MRFGVVVPQGWRLDLTGIEPAAQWTAMLARLGERAHQPQRPPEIVVETDRAIATGTIAIAIEALAEPTSLCLRVRRGIVPGGALDLGRPGVVGRDQASEVVQGPRLVQRLTLQGLTGLGGVASHRSGHGRLVPRRGQRWLLGRRHQEAEILGVAFEGRLTNKVLRFRVRVPN